MSRRSGRLWRISSSPAGGPPCWMPRRSWYEASFRVRPCMRSGEPFGKRLFTRRPHWQSRGGDTVGVAIVTGSSGLIGSETVEFLCEHGFDVVGIDNDMRAYFF